MIVKHMDIPDTTRIFVVGDIHGCYTMLMEELNNTGFNFDEDLLVSVGDCQDRGTENILTFSLFSKSWFIAVKGNHEDFCIKGLDDYRVEFYHKMDNNGGAWFYELPREDQETMVECFDKLPILLDIKWRGKKFGFVHADVPVQDWDLLCEMVENNDRMLDEDRTVVDYCLWNRGVVNLDTVDIAGIDRVFLGHTVLPEIKDVGNCTFLDTGGVFRQEGTPYKLSIVKLEDYL